MKISDERAAVLVEFLNADQERANKLLALDAIQAVQEINAHGFDFTADELKTFAEVLRKSAEQLDDDALNNVAGGVSDVSEDGVIPSFPPFFKWPNPVVPPIHIHPINPIFRW